MRTRRLSETDLARFCALPSGGPLRQALRAYNTGGGAWSYEPVRQSTPDLVNAHTPLLGPVGDVEWIKVSGQITRACKRGEEQREANLEVAALLYHLSRALDWSAVKFEMGRLPIGLGESVQYWSDVVLDDGDGPFIPFFDFRRALGVSSVAIRRVIFSLQRQIIDRHLDLGDARVAIIQFPQTRSLRRMTIHFDQGVELIGYDELNAKVAEVYSEWAAVSEEREFKKRASGGNSPFGF